MKVSKKEKEQDRYLDRLGILTIPEIRTGDLDFFESYDDALDTVYNIYRKPEALVDFLESVRNSGLITSFEIDDVEVEVETAVIAWQGRRHTIPLRPLCPSLVINYSNEYRKTILLTLEDEMITKGRLIEIRRSCRSDEYDVPF